MDESQDPKIHCRLSKKKPNLPQQPATDMASDMHHAKNESSNSMSASAPTATNESSEVSDIRFLMKVVAERSREANSAAEERPLALDSRREVSTTTPAGMDDSSEDDDIAFSKRLGQFPLVVHGLQPCWVWVGQCQLLPSRSRPLMAAWTHTAIDL